MTITRAAPVLMVDDVARSVAFYRDVLGFTFLAGVVETGRETVVDWPPPGPLVFAMIESGQARLMFETRSSMAADLPRFAEGKRGGSLILYLECDDLDALYREARDMFELRDRYKTLDYKLRMIQENLELISELLQHRNANSLELAIIILIAVEIVLFVLEIFFMK